MAFDSMYEEEDRVTEDSETVAIIKPDAVRMGGGVIGRILMHAATADLHPVVMKMGVFTRPTWEEFYAEHRERDFYPELINFMCSGSSVVMVLRGEHALTVWRAIMGATDPLKAQPGTIRRMFGQGGPANAVHGSDSVDSFFRERALLLGQ